MPKMMPAWPEDNFDTVEDYIATIKRLYPSLAAIWDEVMEEQTKHTVKTTLEGKMMDKMSEAEFKALNNTVGSYVPEYSKIQDPMLSFFALQDGSAFLSSEHMTEEQKALVMDFFKTVRQPYTRQYIEQFQRQVPHAKVVVIPNGHHYCFMKQEEIIYNEMRKFLLE